MDIVIGKARVIGVEEVSLDSQPKGGALSGVQTAPAKKQSMVVSRLKIEPAGKTEGFTSIEGVMMIPAQLPFGKTYELTLHDTGNALEGNDRMFKEEGEAS